MRTSKHALNITLPIAIIVATGLCASSPETADEQHRPSQSALATHFIHRDSLFHIVEHDAKRVASVGRDAFLAPNGLVSWLAGKPADSWLSQRGYGTSVEVHRLNMDGQLVPLRRYELSTVTAIRTTALAGDILYLTGRLGGFPLGYYDTRKSDVDLVPIPLPEKVKQKTFDDLIIDGNRLLAVDNIYRPKWLVVYDISNPAAPEPKMVAELLGGVNEHILRGAVGTNYLVLFCESRTMGGQHQSLQIYDKTKGFSPAATVSLWNGDYKENSIGYRESLVMSFAGDLLLLAGYGKGVAVLDCSPFRGRDPSSNDDFVASLFALPRINFNTTPPARLYVRDSEETEHIVMDAIALPLGNQVAVWIEPGGDGIIVNADALYSQNP